MVWSGTRQLIKLAQKPAYASLYFLKQLKQVGLAADQLCHFYLSAIRPILEYCSAVWHHGLTKAQVEQLEVVQRRTLRIIFEVTFNMPCDGIREYLISTCVWSITTISRRCCYRSTPIRSLTCLDDTYHQVPVIYTSRFLSTTNQSYDKSSLFS